MMNVACFCGCSYSFAGNSGVCPKCGEHLALTPSVTDEGQAMDAHFDHLRRQPGEDPRPEEMAA